MSTMARARLSAEADVSEELRRSQILDAAVECFVQLGISRTSVQDVALMAGVSRGTIYRYFEDRQQLVDAAMQRGAQQFYRDAAAMMDRRDDLASQVGAMAETMAKTLVEHKTRNRLMGDDEALLRKMMVGGSTTARNMTEFLLPYVKAAKERGEIARDIDVGEACEWIFRMINSISTVQDSRVFNIDKPKTVGRFVQQYIVRGLR